MKNFFHMLDCDCPECKPDKDAKGFFFIMGRGWQVNPWNPDVKLWRHVDIVGKRYRITYTRRKNWQE